jgi:phage gpG-like protein
MISYTISGVTDLVATISRLTDSIRAELKSEMEYIIADLTAGVVADKLSGQVLNRVSGRLAAGVSGKVDDVAGGAITGTTFVSGVPYAAIQEYGGTTSPHEILPNVALALRFEVPGGIRFAARVNHPGSKMPERSYLRSELHDMSAQILQSLQDAVERGVAK